MTEEYEVDLIPIDFCLEPTSRCDRWCPWCSERSTPCGVDLEYEQIEGMMNYMLEEEFYDKYIVMHSHITGSGESVMHSDIMTFARATTLVSWDYASMVTSGPNTTEEMQRCKQLSEFSRKLRQGVWVGSDGEEHKGVATEKFVPSISLHRNPDSYRRLANMVECAFPWIDLRYRQMPNQSLFSLQDETYEVWKEIEKLGFVKEFWRPNIELESRPIIDECLKNEEYDEEIIEMLAQWSSVTWANKHGHILHQFDLEYVQPFGRGEDLLGKPPKVLSEGRCPMTDYDGIQLRVSPNGKLFLCHCANQMGYDTTEEGLKQALTDADELRRYIKQLQIADLGMVEWGCDRCPLRSHEPKLIAL